MSSKFKKALIKSISCSYRSPVAAGIAVGLILNLMGIFAEPATAKTLFWGRDKKVVVLDPGHGGDDIGAKGPAGAMEKTLVLRLAGRIEAELKADFRVSMTRTDDYQLAVERRTEMANNQQADIFISIHAGGSFSPSAGGISVYTFAEAERMRDAAPRQPPRPQKDSDKSESWDRIQLPHQAESRRLAETVKSRLDHQVTYASCQVSSAPLTVLRGADMPSILIEIGYLTNPMEEKALMDENVLNDLARAVSDGVNDFFKAREHPASRKK